MFYLNSQLLYFVPVVAILALAMVLANHRRKRLMQEAYGEAALLAETSKPLTRGRYIARAVFAALAAAALMLALARPVLQNGSQTIAQGSVDVIAAVDVSRSMAAMDYEGKVPATAVAKRLIEVPTKTRPLAPPATSDKPEDTGTRLEMVRHIMLDYMIATLDGNQLGIVSYAGEAFPQAFLGRDLSALRWAVDRGLTISSAPGEGSGLVKALVLSGAMFDADSPAGHEKLLVLFSDGGSDDDQAKLMEAARALKDRHIKLLVVALGNVMPSKIPVSKLAADDDFARSLQSNGKRWVEIDGQVEKTGMDVALLQNLANQAGGTFIHLQDMSDLNLLKYLGQKSLTNVPGTMELFPYLLVLGLICLVMSFAVTNQWQRRKT
ncbi:MAG: VWA domain-containing protein [Cyanobacteria bacterium SZAS LIN-2]|nr:VWA domain-containing protein [Cyanobacteria bacterium SZAS LIN-2]